MKNFLNSSAISWGLLFFLALLWGSSFILMKKGLQSYSPIQLSSLRIFSAFIFLIPFSQVSYKNVPSNKLPFHFLSGVIGNLIPAFLFALAQTKLQSSVAGILNSLSPIFVMLISFILFNQRFKTINIVGIFLGFVGCFLLVSFNNSTLKFQFNFYVIFIIVATFCYGLSANIIKFKLSSIKPLYNSTLAIVSIGPIAALLFYFSGGFDVMLNHSNVFNATLSILFLGIIGTAFALVLFNKLIQSSPIIFASSVTYLIPIVAIFWGLTDGETLGFFQFFGIAIIFLGVLLVRK